MAIDPKYEWHEGRVWNREGGYFIPEDEPVMLFRGKSAETPRLVRAYIAFMQAQEQTPDVIAHTESAQRHLETIERFQQKYPERVGLGCSSPRLKAFSILPSDNAG
jgi:hypothetical protein